MRSSDIFKEYVWLLETIWRTGRITLDELADRWEQSQMGVGRSFNRSTFNRHRSAVERIFGILIECDRATDSYYIPDADSIKGHTMQDWMVSTLSVNNLLGEAHSLKDRIILENVPVAGDILKDLIKAMKDNRLVSFNYQRYGNEAHKIIVAPYCLRLFHNRWYLLGKIDSSYWLFSFDRISVLKISEKQFVLDPNFCAKEYFSDFYGVMTDKNIPRQRIVIRARGYARFYIKDLPLHPSQTMIADTPEHTDFEYYLRPTNDFLSAIFSNGGYVKILSPSSLNETIKSWASNMMTKLDEE